MVTFTIHVHILPAHRFFSNGGYLVECLQDRNAVFPAAADIVDLTATRVLEKRVNESCNVERMDVVSYLLTLVTVYLVQPAILVAFHEITEKTVQFNAAVIGTCKTASPQTAGAHAEV